MKEQIPYRKAVDIDYPDDAFARADEDEDLVFYTRDRFVNHLDDKALSTVKQLIWSLVVESKPEILDLMAGWNSHLHPDMTPGKVVGLGLNANELKKNEALTEAVVHDLNKDPALPFPDDAFDVVLNTVSVDYMTKPFEVFCEVARILKPGGLFLVIFSTRMFPEKAVKIWKESTEQERVMLVLDYFRRAEGFDSPRVFVSKGEARPSTDKYAHLKIPSDPIYAVYAEKPGGLELERVQREAKIDEVQMPPAEVIAKRKAEAKEMLCCPYCGERMKKWAVPQTPFTEWAEEYFYICFNDVCPYVVRGWKNMQEQGNFGFSYRTMYLRERNVFNAVPVQSLKDLRQDIVEEEE